MGRPPSEARPSELRVSERIAAALIQLLNESVFELLAQRLRRAPGTGLLGKPASAFGRFAPVRRAQASWLAFAPATVGTRPPPAFSSLGFAGRTPAAGARSGRGNRRHDRLSFSGKVQADFEVRARQSLGIVSDRLARPFKRAIRLTHGGEDYGQK